MRKIIGIACLASVGILRAGQDCGDPEVSGGEASRMENGCWKIVCTPGARQVNVRFLSPDSNVDAEGVVIDFYSDDVSHFHDFYQRIFESDHTKYARYRIQPLRSGEWTPMRLERGGGTLVGGGITNWGDLGEVKFTVDIVDPEGGTFYLGRPRVVACPRLRTGSATERRVAWVTVHALGDDDWESAAAFLAKYKFTDMVAQVARSGCAYYESQYLPRAKGFPVKKDVAHEALSACRRHGLKCHFWKTVWQVRNDTPTDFLQQLESENRFQVSDAGQVNKGWLCPSDPRNRAAEIDVMTEFMELGADAVHLDYIRYVGEKHCFCDRCLAAFSARIGRSVSSAAEIRGDMILKTRWMDWRAGMISDLVRDVASLAHARQPRVEVSAAVFGKPDQDYASHAQDWPRWCREGWLDMVCTMDYFWSPGIHRGFVEREKKLVEGTRTLLCPGIAVTCASWPLIPADNLIEELSSIRELRCDGFSVFGIGKAAEEVFPRVFGK